MNRKVRVVLITATGRTGMTCTEAEANRFITELSAKMGDTARRLTIAVEED